MSNFIDEQNFIHHRIKKIDVVAYYENTAFIRFQILRYKLFRRRVEVVCRLVQKQNFWVGVKNARKSYLRLLSARQVFNAHIQKTVVDIHIVYQFQKRALGVILIESVQPLLQFSYLGEQFRLLRFVGNGKLVIDFFEPLFKFFYRSGFAQIIPHRFVSVGKLDDLREITYIRAAERYCSAVKLEFFANNAKKRGFTRAVDTHYSYFIVFVCLKFGIVIDDFGAERQMQMTCFHNDLTKKCRVISCAIHAANIIRHLRL